MERRKVLRGVAASGFSIAGVTGVSAGSTSGKAGDGTPETRASVSIPKTEITRSEIEKFESKDRFRVHDAGNKVVVTFSQGEFPSKRKVQKMGRRQVAQARRRARKQFRETVEETR